MSEYATSTTNTNPVTNPATYWRVTAFLLAAVALLGIVLTAMGEKALLGKDFLAFDWTHNIVHVALAGAAFLFGFGNLPAKAVGMMAIVFGVVYAGLGVLGFFGSGDLLNALNLHLELGENLVHLLIGAWGLVSGFASRGSWT